MTIEKSIRYAYADKDNGDWRKNLPKNVIPFIFKKPFLQEIEEMEKKELEKLKDKKTKKPIKRYASYTPEIDDAIMAMEYWTERFENHQLRHKFRTLKEFISWSLANEDQPTFQKGGKVSSNGLAYLLGE